MNAKFLDLFPLSVFQDKIFLSQDDKKEIINHIFAVEKDTQNITKRKQDAWLGDTRGQEFLLKHPIMEQVSILIEEKIKAYTEMLSLDNEKLCFFLSKILGYYYTEQRAYTAP